MQIGSSFTDVILGRDKKGSVEIILECSETFEPGVSWDLFNRGVGGSHLTRMYYYSYCRLRDEQEELRNGGEFFGHLCTTLISLLNLQKVVLTNLRNTQGLCWCHQAYVDGHSRTFNPWSDEQYPVLGPLRPAPDHNCLTSFYGLSHREYNAWPELLRALFTSGKSKVKSMVAEGGYRDKGLVIGAFCMTPRHRFCAAQVLPNLTSLHLDLDLDFVDDYDVTIYVEEELYMDQVVAKTLSAAINLKSLIIELVGELVHEEDGGPDKITTFGMILGGCRMPKLVNLGLSCFPITEAGMTAFLQDSPEIRRMSLDDVEIVLGSWEKVFQTLKDDLSLETIKTRGLRGGNELLKGGHFREGYEHGPLIENFLFGDGLNPFCKVVLDGAPADI